MKTAHLIYSRKEGSTLTGSDVKQLYAAISNENNSIEKIAQEMLNKKRIRAE